MAEYFRHHGHTLRFIEFMDVGTTNHWRRDEVVPAEEIRDRLAARWPLEPVDAAYPGEVAARYRYLDGAGEIGFINSVTHPFCGACTRARLSADGRLYTCLFASSGSDLRDLLRGGASDGDLTERIRGVWEARADRYSELRAGMAGSAEDPGRSKIEMSYIGG
jgi:cyclic pyranopterin phosphate synthase